MEEPKIKEIFDPYELNELSNKEKKEVAIVIPTYNQYKETKKLISLLKKQTLMPSIIVVDNNSDDNTFEKLKKDFSDIILIKAKDNYGSSGGQYLGQKYAYEKGYKYIILSDNDAYPVDNDLIEYLINEKKKYKSAVVPKNKYYLYMSDLTHSYQFHYLTIDRNIIQNVGFVDYKWFLKLDDFDYTYRIFKKFGYIKIINKYYIHPLKTFTNILPFYYFVKNGTYFGLKNKKILTNIIDNFQWLIYALSISIRYKNLKFIRTFFKGLLHACIGRFGNLNKELPKNLPVGYLNITKVNGKKILVISQNKLLIENLKDHINKTKLNMKCDIYFLDVKQSKLSKVKRIIRLLLKNNKYYDNIIFLGEMFPFYFILILKYDPIFVDINENENLIFYKIDL